MKVGDKFSSYEEFTRVLAVYKKSVNNEFWIRDARTIENQRKRAPDSVENINKSLKYYHMRLACVKGGRAYKSKNEKSKRKCTTYKEDCEATIFVRVSPCRQYLCVLELKDNHNHISFETYFTTLSQRKAQPEKVKGRKKDLLAAGVENKVVVDSGIETNKKVTLGDLTNLHITKEKNDFVDCINMLQDTYDCCDIQLLTDDDEIFRGLYFQDQRMKKYMEAFPETLLIDGIYCSVDIETTTYVIMIEDGCGFSEIVAVCLLVNDDELSMNLFMETFKYRNSSWEKVQVVLSDKDKTQRKIFEKHFPNSKSLISLFHVFQLCNKEISSKRMGISTDDVHIARQYIQKLAYVISESEYSHIYNDMAKEVPKIVKDYYDSEWNCITDQWVQYLTFQNIFFENKTNNILETVCYKLKNVINKSCPLEQYIKLIFTHIHKVRVEKDFKNSHLLYRKSAKLFDKESPEYNYREHLTTFAFEKVEKQLNLLKNFNPKKLHSIGGDVFLTEVSDALIQVTPLSCECLFRKISQLPCLHIFSCRSQLSLPLFDITLYVRRWSRLVCIDILKQFVINKNTDQELESNDTPVINYNEANELNQDDESKMINDRVKKMTELCRQVPTTILHERLKIIDTIINHWETGRDEILNDLFKDVLQERNKPNDDDLGNSGDREISSSIKLVKVKKFTDDLNSNAYEMIDMHELELEELNDLLQIDNVVDDDLELHHEEEIGLGDIVQQVDIKSSNVDCSGSIPKNRNKRQRKYCNTMVGLKRKRYGRK